MDCTPFLVANSGNSSLSQVGVLYIILCCLLVLRPSESKKVLIHFQKLLTKLPKFLIIICNYVLYNF